MKIPLSKALGAATIVIFLVVFYVLGGITSHWIHRFFLSFPSSPYEEPGTRKAASLQEDTQPETQFETILEKNIFGAKRAPKEIADDSGATGEHPSSSNLELMGTARFSKNRFAFISKKGQVLQYVIFQEGDCIIESKLQKDPDCGPGSFRVTEVLDRQVSLDNGGHIETLVMNDAVKPQLEAPPPVKTESSSKKNSASTESVEAEYEKDSAPSSNPQVNVEMVNGEEVRRFQKIWVDQQLADFGKIIRDARVVPTTNDKGETLFKFKFIKPKSLYEELGLKRDDIVLEINHSRIDNVAKALSLMEILKSERDIVLRVTRNNQEKIFHYYIE